MARLRIVDAGGGEQFVELRAARLQIGRGRDNELVLPDAEKGVSRTHAELRLENGRYVIVDLQSQNGTWVNGRRVERAEVPPGAEIALGEYRLTLEEGDEASGGVARPADADNASTRELPMRARPVQRQPAAAAPPVARGGRWLVGVIVAVAITVVVAAVAWVKTSTAAAPAPSGAATPSAPHTVDTPAVPAPSGTQPVTSGVPPPSLPEASPRKPSTDTVAGASQTTGARVGRRPGESTEAWRVRSAALQMRYAYSKAALERDDFAAAAGGFEAILQEEPGFLDAPRLLVQAQAGLRGSAVNLFTAGTKLDAAGDWMGALQKYEQARQIYSGIPGLAESLQRVRGKLTAAGTDAFNQARQHEANGRTEEALKEYEKAVQWLRADDPNRHIARARIEQLRKS